MQYAVVATHRLAIMTASHELDTCACHGQDCFFASDLPLMSRDSGGIVGTPQVSDTGKKATTLNM